MCSFRRTLVGGVLAALVALIPLCPAGADEPAPVVTKHAIKIAGRRLAYTAEAGRTPIRDVATGEPIGYIFYVAYRMPAPVGKVRPITFVWNGGPGMAAASTHFEGAGPRRIEGDRLVDNADTYLTDSDLVFMDPVGTGFSRATTPDALKAFTSWIGDVMASTEFIRSWLLLHGEEDRPLVISGQSYGAGRAGSVAYQLLKRGFKVRGLALVSNTTGLPRYREQDTIALAMHIGDYAVAANYYKKLEPGLSGSPDAVRASAEQWARAVYLPALRRADALSEAERVEIRAELARHIGLEPGDISLASLKITQGFFLGHLQVGKRLYYSDYRVEEPFHAPVLALGIRYIRHDLGYPSDLPYLGEEAIEQGFAPDGTYPKSVNATWIHTTVYGATADQIEAAKADFAKLGVIGMGKFGPNLPGAGEAILLDPKLKVLVAHAAYDPLGGCSLDAELGRQLASPYKEAVHFQCYLAGHAIYRDAPARAQLAADMRQLAREAAERP